MSDQTTTSTTATVNTPVNPIEAYKSYLAELAHERDAIKASMQAAALRLKEINEIIDGERASVTEIKSLLTATRKRRESKAPVEINAADGQPVAPKKRGRKSNAQKEAEKQAASTAQ